MSKKRSQSSPGPFDDLVLIGVDGGASEVKAHEVAVISTAKRLVLGLGAASASCCYDRAPGFEPLPIDEQMAAFERGAVEPTEAETAQAHTWIDAAARSIVAVAGEVRRPALVGMCMPGLKTADGRGIAVLRHGPRMPYFLDRLEERLVRDGLVLAQPIGRLIGDGEACALGEDTHAHGALRDVADAYYIGGGTGLAEALKLGGSVVSFDALRGSLDKAWQLESELGGTFESLISMGGMNRAYADRTGRALPVEQDEFPEERALAGDRAADEILERAAEGLAELIFMRLSALRRGAAGPERLLERVVLGQRLARLFAEAEFGTIFRARIESALTRRIVAARDPSIAERSMDGAGLARGFVRASSLRAAPAIGAAAAALADRTHRPRGRGTVERTH